MIKKIKELIENNLEYLALIFFMNPIIYRSEILPLNIRLYYFIIVQYSVAFLFVFAGYENDNVFQYIKKNIEAYKSLIIFSLVIIFVELINMSSLSDLKYPVFYIGNLVTTVYVINNTIMNYGKSFDSKISNLLRVTLKISVFFSLLNLIFPNKIIWIDNKKYLMSNFLFNVSTIQHMIGRGISGRYASFFSNVNTFGEFVFLVLFILVLNKKDSSKHNILKTFSFVFLGLTLSKSRNSLISVSLFLFLTILFQSLNIHKIKRIVNGYFLLLTLTLCSLIYLYRSDLISDIFNGRLFLWSEAIDSFLLSPLIGVGSNNFRNIIQQYGANSHNTFLQLLASGGLLYLVIYFLFIRSYLKLSYSLYNSNRQLMIVSLAFILVSIFYRTFETKVYDVYISNVFMIYTYIYLSFQNKISEGD